MTSPITTDFHLLVQEQKRKQAGIDFQRAYRALIRGFIRAKTRPSESEQDNRKVQDARKTHIQTTTDN